MPTQFAAKPRSIEFAQNYKNNTHTRNKWRRSSSMNLMREVFIEGSDQGQHNIFSFQIVDEKISRGSVKVVLFLIQKMAHL